MVTLWNIREKNDISKVVFDFDEKLINSRY